jgi:hypothetical protein
LFSFFLPWFLNIRPPLFSNLYLYFCHPFSVSLSPAIYKGEKGERGPLPLSSHDTRVEWSGGHWVVALESPAGLVSSAFLSW